MEGSRISEEWCGEVLKSSCGLFYGVYRDKELCSERTIFLGNSEEQALQRMPHVKSFL